MDYGKFSDALVLIIGIQMFMALKDSTEKYLFEYDYMNPFIVLMYEGIFGFILTFLFFLIQGYLDDIKAVYKNKNFNFALFVFLLFLYVILSAGKNIFLLVTTKIYSPMTKSLTDYFLNPIYILYSYGVEKDFHSEGKLNIPYFIINIFLSLIISFFGCVFNEFIILLFCGLELDTYDQISQRSISNITTELVIFEDNCEDEDSQNDSDNDTETSK